jgi:fumarate hydratase class I
MPELWECFLELVRKASTELPGDVTKAIKQAAEAESSPAAAHTLELLLRNADESRRLCTPICQDTGTPIFYVEGGPEFGARDVEAAIHRAVEEATKKYYLRPNAVDPLTGKNSGNNIGKGFPYIHFEERTEPGLHARLMLKGGGSENVGAQYRLPDGRLKAGRDLEGVRRCVLDAVWTAQGEGCAPGIIAVGVGGDRGSSFIESKEQLFRNLEDTNPIPELAALEERLMNELNQLGIGPMGFGGRTTVLGVKIGTRHRVPACYFVSVSYLCWAARKAKMNFNGEKAEYE